MVVTLPSLTCHLSAVPSYVKLITDPSAHYTDPPGLLISFAGVDPTARVSELFNGAVLPFINLT
jgi:hypothetical protein